MAFKTCGRPYRIQDCVFKSIGSILFRAPLLFVKNQYKFTGTQVLPSKSVNIMAAAPTNSNVSLRVYTNKDVQDIIQAIIKVRLVAAESLCKHLFKICFFDIYKSDNHMVCYNFCQQYKDYFAIAQAKRPNHILFVALFF